MKKSIIAFVIAAAMTVSACGSNNVPNCDPSQPDCQQAMAQAVQQNGGSFVNNHPIATAAIAAGGAYMVGKAVQNHRNGYNTGPMVGGYHRTYVPVQRVYASPVYRTPVYRPSYSSYRPMSTTTTRTVSIRRR